MVDKSGRFHRLQASFKKQLLALAAEFQRLFQEPLVLTDTVRTQAEQARLHQEKPTLALPAHHPRAMHPKGLAVDVDSRQAALLTEELLARHGLHRPALGKGETWHIEPLFTPLGQAVSQAAAPSGSPGMASLLAALRRERGHSPSGLAGLASLSSASDRSRLRAAAQEVEALFLEKLLQNSRQTMAGPLKTTRIQPLQQYVVEHQFARALAAAGGIGLAAKILQELAHKEPPHGKGPVDPRKPGTPVSNPLV